MVSPSSFRFSPYTVQSALGLFVLQKKGSLCTRQMCVCKFRDTSAACAYRGSADARVSCFPLNAAKAEETLQTPCKCLWSGSWCRAIGKSKTMSFRGGEPPASLAGRDIQYTLPFLAFPSRSVGYYMFIEASRPRVTGDKARLISPLYNITAKYYCVSFYYHMYGKHIGEYPLGKGNPSLVHAAREDLQTLALPAVPVASNSEGWESYSSAQRAKVAAAFRYLSLTHTPAMSGLWGCCLGQYLVVSHHPFPSGSFYL